MQKVAWEGTRVLNKPVYSVRLHMHKACTLNFKAHQVQDGADEWTREEGYVRA